MCSGSAAGRKCAEQNRCVFPDSVNEFLDIAGDYDGFVFGSPVHWGAAFLDRAFYADLNDGGGRFASAVISARRAGTAAAWDQLNKYFGLMQMPIITSRYWNMVHGTTPDEVRQDLEGTRTMQALGHHMVNFLNARESGIRSASPCRPGNRPCLQTLSAGNAMKLTGG